MIQPRPLHLSLLAFLLVFACKSVPQSGSSTLKLDPALPHSNSLLWQISGNGLQQASYLYGTIHLIDEGNYTFGANAQQKLEQSQELVLEVDLSQLNIIGLAQQSLLPGGKTVKDYMSDSDYVVLQTFLADSIGINARDFASGYAKFKPFFLEQLLYVRHMGQRNESYEINLQRMAENKNISISGLETMEEQLKLLDARPIEDQLKDLVETISEYGKETERLDRLIQLYAKQDLDGLTKEFEAEDDSLMMEQLLHQRNRNWIPVIRSKIAQKSCFIAVGAGHLGGPQGVIRLLQQEGYTVVPISTER